MGMDLISYKASKRIAASALAGVSSMTVDGQTLNIVTKDGTTLPMTFPTPKDGDKGEPGKDGKDGKSPYDIAVDNGFVGTETEWLESLKATDGKDGVTPVRGKDYWTSEDIAEIQSYIDAQIRSALNGGFNQPTSPVLDSIVATKTQTSYTVGDTFTVADIIVTAYYSDSTTKEVTSSAIIDTGNVNMDAANTFNIQISYTENGVTKTTSIDIVVSEVTSDPDPTPVVPQTGTWQLKNTTGKKYIILGTDDDNSGNAKYFRLLRTYGFPYTMNVEAETVSELKALGSDVDDTIFTDSDAPALFSDGVDVVTLGKYLHDNDLGEVAQHGASSSTLWDSEKLTGDFLTSLHTSYTEQGGTKTEEELRTAIMEQLADTDGSQGATYVDTSRSALEEAYGFPIYTVGAWGGSPTATIDGIACNLNSIKGTSNYDWRAKNYTAVGALVGQFGTNKSTYDLARVACGVDEVSGYIERMEAGKVCEFFWHMPFNDESDISKWRTLFDYIKGLVDSGKAEVVTRKQYAELGEYVDNPIIKITISRDNIPVGESDSDSSYTITATYADATTSDVTNEAILDRSAVNTEEVGNYTVTTTYRGFSSTITVSVIDTSYTVPDGLKDADYWFVAKNDTQNIMIAGNTTGAFGSAGNSSGALAFLNCTSGNMNGWISTDGGVSWSQVNTAQVHYKTVKTNTTEGTSGFNFGSVANDSITFLETSGNFEITYGS